MNQFKNLAISALPLFAMLGLNSVENLPRESFTYTNKVEVIAAKERSTAQADASVTPLPGTKAQTNGNISDCNGTCSGTCYGSCHGLCDSTCTGTCHGSCYGQCDSTCTGTCHGSCHGMCNSTCSGTCNGYK